MSLRSHHNSTSMLVGMTSFLVVRLGLNYLALPAAGVRGILTQEATNHKRAVTEAGIIYQPVNLAERLSVAANLSGIDIKTVLYSNGRSYGAVCVELVVGLIDVERKDCFPLPLQFQCDERCWFGGMMFYHDRLVLILNPSWVLRELAETVSAPIGMTKQMVPAIPETIGA